MIKKEVEGGAEEKSEDAFEELADRELEQESGEGEHEDYTYYELFAIVISYVLVVLTFPLSLIFCFKIIYEYEKAIILRLGKLRKGGARGPGPIFILPCIDQCFVADLRTETVYVYPQQVLTKDSVSIHLEAVIFFRLQDAIRGFVAVGDYKYATLLLAQATLRSISGERTLLELLVERRKIMQLMHEMLVKGTGPWGVVVERVEIKDIRLPVDMQRSMAAEAEANRTASAKIVSAEGEKIAANALKIASETISSSPGAIQMRYLQTLRSSVAGNNNIYVLPLSKEIHQMFRAFMSRL